MEGEPRWAQLTYTTYDKAGSASGGWLVKDRDASVSAEESKAVESRAVIAFDAVDELPKFPTPEQVEHLPRRFSYFPLDRGTTRAYWHAVPCGLDGAGRPGNVFTHAVIDRAPRDDSPDFRPIDLWRSDRWLTPFGQAEVVGTALPSGGPWVSPGPLDQRRVVEFLLSADDWRRASLLPIILDAVAAHRDGGPVVVLASDSPETTALWIGAVSRFLSPRNAREMSFSVFERAGSIESARDRGASIIGIPLVDVDTVSKLSGVVVIDERQDIRLGDRGGAPHRVGSAEVVVSPFSVVAQVALQDASVAATVLRLVEEVSAELSTDSLAPALPLAMAGALMQGEFAEVTDDIMMLLRDRTPASLSSSPRLWDAASSVAHASFGRSTADVWKQVELTSGPEISVIHELAATVYTERLLLDRDWVLQQDGPPVPTSGVMAKLSGRIPVEAVEESLASWVQALHTASISPLDAAVGVFRACDWLITTGVFSAHEAVLERTFAHVLAECAYPALVAPDGDPTLVHSLRMIDRSFRADWPRLALAAMVETGHPRPSPQVVEWLFDGTTELPADESGRLDMLTLIWLSDMVRRHRPISLSHRVAAVQSALESEHPDAFAVLETLLSDQEAWTVRSVLDVEMHTPGTIPSLVVESVLRRFGDDPVAMILVAELDRSHASRATPESLSYLKSLYRKAQRINSDAPLSAADMTGITAIATEVFRDGRRAVLSMDVASALAMSSLFEFLFGGFRVLQRPTLPPIVQNELASATSRMSNDDVRGAVARHARKVADRIVGVLGGLLAARALGAGGLADSNGFVMDAPVWRTCPGVAESWLDAFIDELASRAPESIDVAARDAETRLAELVAPGESGRRGDKLSDDTIRSLKSVVKELKSRHQATSRSGMRGLFGSTSATNKEDY